VRRLCGQPLRGHSNPAARDSPEWFDWRGESVDRCEYFGGSYLTATATRADGTVLVVRDEDIYEVQGWPSVNEVSLLGHFCE
jgi:hypothetical protein